MKSVEQWFYDIGTAPVAELPEDLDQALRSYTEAQVQENLDEKKREVLVAMLVMHFAERFKAELTNAASDPDQMVEVEREWNTKARELFATSDLALLRWGVAGAFSSIMDACKQEYAKVSGWCPRIDNLTEDSIFIPSRGVSGATGRATGQPRGQSGGTGCVLIVAVPLLVIATLAAAASL